MGIRVDAERHPAEILPQFHAVNHPKRFVVASRADTPNPNFDGCARIAAPVGNVNAWRATADGLVEARDQAGVDVLGRHGGNCARQICLVLRAIADDDLLEVHAFGQNHVNRRASANGSFFTGKTRVRKNQPRRAVIDC